MLKGLLGFAKAAVEKAKEAGTALNEMQQNAFLSSFADFTSVEEGVVCSVKESSLVVKVKAKWFYSNVSHTDQISGRVGVQRLRVSILDLFFDGWKQSEEEGVYTEQGEQYLKGLLYKTPKDRYFVVTRYKKYGQQSFKRQAFIFEDDNELKSWSSKNIDIETYIQLFDS